MKLVKCMFKEPTSKGELVNKFEIDSSEWEAIHTLRGKVIIDAKSKIFQYKILNNILSLNDRLNKMKKVSSPLYNFCRNVP